MRHYTILLFAALMLCVGCATTPEKREDQLRQAQKAAAYIEIAAEGAVNNTLPGHEDLRPYYVAAVELIDSLANQTDYDPAKLEAAIRAMKIKEVQDPRVARNLASALQLYKLEAADRVAAKLDYNVFVRPLLLALRNGIQKGLDTNQAPVSSNTVR